MTKYAFYLELTPPVFTVDAETIEEATKKAEEMIVRCDADMQYKIHTNLYADEFWELEGE